MDQSKAALTDFLRNFRMPAMIKLNTAIAKVLLGILALPVIKERERSDRGQVIESLKGDDSRYIALITRTALKRLKTHKMQVGKGGLPPLKTQLIRSQVEMVLERGQATLPNLHLLS
jgi:hypothetical protein